MAAAEQRCWSEMKQMEVLLKKDVYRVQGMTIFCTMLLPVSDHEVSLRNVYPQLRVAVLASVLWTF